MTDLDQATKILENIKTEVDEVERLILSEKSNAPETTPAPVPSFEAEAKPEGSITSKLLNTFNTIKENVESVIPNKAPAPTPEVEATPAPEIEAAPAPEVEAVPAFEAPAPVAAPTETEAEAITTTGGSASEDALNAILGAPAELPSQTEAPIPAPEPAPEELTPVPAPNEG